MEITCRCAACGSPFKVDVRFIGRRAKCPKCAQVTVVTAPEGYVAEERPAAPSPPPHPPTPSSTSTTPPAASGAPGRSRFLDSPPADDEMTSPDIPSLAPPAGGGGVFLNPLPPEPPAKPTRGGGGRGESAPATPPSRFSGAPAPAKPPGAPKAPAHAAANAGAAGSAAPVESGESDSTFPIKVITSGTGGKRGASRGRSDAGGKKIPMLGWVIGGGVAALLLAIGCLVAVVVVMSGRNPQLALVGSKPKLVIELPREGRKDIKLLLNSRPYMIPATGPVELVVEEGLNQLTLQRRGYLQVDHSFTLRKGENVPFQPTWEKSLPPLDPQMIGGAENPSSPGFPSVPSDQSAGPQGFGGWLQNLEVAQRRALELKRDIFLVFAGSDWSNQTHVMAEAIFSQPRFRSFAEQRFVLMVVDLPRTEAGINQLENINQNRALSLQFGIRSVPTVLLLDAGGTPYAADGFFGDGLDKYIQHITLMQNKHAQRDVRVLAVESSKSKSPQERLAALETAVTWLDQEKLTPHYGRVLAQWLLLAKQLDPQNELGKLEVLVEADWIARLNSALVDRERAKVTAVLTDLLNWSGSHKFRDADRAVRVHSIAAMLLIQVMDDFDSAARHVALARTYSPRDDKLKQELSGLDNWLRKRDQLSSGTGFIVGEGGYVLTNHHVIEGPGKTVVRIPTQGGMTNATATVVATDPQQDIALLKVDPQQFPSFKPVIISPDRVRRGSEVAVFGFPLGDDLGKDVRITTGVVHSPSDQSEDKRHVLDCRINPGNSGGPVLNRLGRVIGMVTAKTVGGAGVDSYGVAIPANDLQTFLAQHLPGYVSTSPSEPAAGDGEGRLEWEQVDERVAPAVLMVLKVKEN